jgi:hypothetical protein
LDEIAPNGRDQDVSETTDMLLLRRRTAVRVGTGQAGRTVDSELSDGRARRGG